MRPQASCLCSFGEFLAGDWMQFNRGLLLLAGVSIAHHDLEIRASFGKTARALRQELPVRFQLPYATTRYFLSSRPWLVLHEVIFSGTPDPLVDRLLIGANMGPVFVEPPRQIIGVVGDMRHGGLDQDPSPTMYIPVAQMPDKVTALNSRITPLWWIVRSHVEPHTLVRPIAVALREATGGLPVGHVRTMNEIAISTISRQRFSMLLLTIFGSSALLMAAIGIYGFMAYSVQQRTQELGIRMALGAQAPNIRNMVVRQGMVLAVIGVVIGIGGAFGLTRFLAGFLFGVKAGIPQPLWRRPVSQSSRPHQHNSFSPMLVHKCDNCKKVIKGRDKEIIAGFAWPQFSFCGRCGKPIIAFLKKRKLLQSKTTG